MAVERRLRCPDEAAGQRLDRFLASAADVARNQVQGWLAQGLVTVDGRAARASTRLEGGEEIAWREPPPVESRVVPEPGELVVLFADEELAVVDKPAGLSVHPGAGRSSGTLVHRLLAHYPELAGVGGEGRPGIVHRLDKDTSGLLVVARTPRAYARLVRAFGERQVDKRYLAVCHGVPSRVERLVDAPVGRHPSRRKEMTVRADGRPARSLVRVRAAARGLALLEVELLTGRTHQIRVHLKSIGHPLVGDPVYGEARWRGQPPPLRAVLADFPRPALHAWRLVLPHPSGTGPLALEAPVPGDLDALWRAISGVGIGEALATSGL